MRVAGPRWRIPPLSELELPCYASNTALYGEPSSTRRVHEIEFLIRYNSESRGGADGQIIEPPLWGEAHAE